jgi:hypothetical protein
MGAPGASLLGTWESTNPNPSGAGVPPTSIPRFFLARTGRRRLAQPRVVFGGMPTHPTISPLFQATTYGCPSRSFIARRVGKHEPQPIRRRCPANFNPAPFFWRGPAAGDWPHRGWCLAGCPLIQPFPPFSKPQLMGVLRAASSREGWESTNLNPSGAGVPPTSIPRLFLARTGRRRLAPPQVVCRELPSLGAQWKWGRRQRRP